MLYRGARHYFGNNTNNNEFGENYIVLDGNGFCNFSEIETLSSSCWEETLALSSSTIEFEELEEWHCIKRKFSIKDFLSKYD